MGNEERKGEEKTIQAGRHGCFTISARKDSRLTHPKYIQCRKLWKEYIEGRISNDELQRGIGADEETIEEVERARDIFEGEVL
jgi:hypothetical protein